MRLVQIIGATIGLGLAAVCTPVIAIGEIGAQAPGFHGMAADGTPINLSDYSGKMVVLEWTNHLCPYVQKHYDSGNMQTLQADAGEAGTVWISVISSAPGKQGHVTPDQALAIAAEKGASPKHILIDETGEIGRAFGASATPHMFLIAEDGTLQYKGAIDDQPSANPNTLATANNYVRAAASALMGGTPVEIAETAAYGCSIKY